MYLVCVHVDVCVGVYRRMCDVCVGVSMWLTVEHLHRIHHPEGHKCRSCAYLIFSFSALDIGVGRANGIIHIDIKKENIGIVHDHVWPAIRRPSHGLCVCPKFLFT